jgi:hypothetical protein
MLKMIGMSLLELGICLASDIAWAGVSDSKQKLSQMGMGSVQLSQAMREFKAMGFGVDVKLVDLDETAYAGWSAKTGNTSSMLFSLASGHGGKASCVVALRASSLGNAPERRLASAAASIGGIDEGEVWMLMVRHELGHCAQAAISKTDDVKDKFVSEAYADVFALSWSKRVLPKEKFEALSKGFTQARKRLSGGAHATGAEISRWLENPVDVPPCRAAWRIAPLDERTEDKACP